jgi:hypothetical protein
MVNSGLQVWATIAHWTISFNGKSQATAFFLRHLPTSVEEFVRIPCDSRSLTTWASGHAAKEVDERIHYRLRLAVKQFFLKSER